MENWRYTQEQVCLHLSNLQCTMDRIYAASTSETPALLESLSSIPQRIKVLELISQILSLLEHPCAQWTGECSRVHFF